MNHGLRDKRAKVRVMRAGRMARAAGPAGLAGRAAWRWAGTQFAWGKRRTLSHDRFLLRTAEDVTRTMGDMKGAVMKVGQVMSMMTGAMPDQLTGPLAGLQANAPPMAFNLVEDVFRGDFGASPGEVFRRFEREPFAAASIGQVHRARLADGTPVAVKVQYPGVREAIEHDLANIGLLMGVAGVAAPRLDLAAMLRELKDGILAELDYPREAAWQRRFGELYEGHAFVRVPRVYERMTTGRVLVQEYLAGRPFRAALELPQEQRNRVAEMVFRFSFGNFYRHSLFQGDPHAGNYLLLPDGAVGFVDYGCVAEFPRETVLRFEELIRALLDHDLEAWRAASERVGIIHAGAPFSTQELYEHMHWFWAPILEEQVTFTPELAGEMVRRQAQTRGRGGAINRPLKIPEGMLVLPRIHFGLAGLLASLHAEGPWQAIVAEYVRGDAPRTELGRLSAATSRGPSV
ncbi:MAG: ABC1 kinase family protein [Tepidiformaceae bacterium]